MAVALELAILIVLIMSLVFNFLMFFAIVSMSGRFTTEAKALLIEGAADAAAVMLPKVVEWIGENQEAASNILRGVIYNALHPPNQGSGVGGSPGAPMGDINDLIPEDAPWYIKAGARYLPMLIPGMQQGGAGGGAPAQALTSGKSLTWG